MKKYIFALICALCCGNVYAQKNLVIYKSDSTKVYVNLGLATDAANTWGRHTVNEGDYVDIATFDGPADYHSIVLQVAQEVHSPFAAEAGMGVGDYLMGKTVDTTIGVLYGTSPGLTTEQRDDIITVQRDSVICSFNGDDKPWNVIVSPYRFGNPMYGPMPDSTYYYRAYVEIFDKVYYGKEVAHVFRPLAADVLGVAGNYSQYEETGYVIPADSAFAQMYLTLTGDSCSATSLHTLKELWLKYMTPEFAKAINKDGLDCRKCHECDVYYLNDVPEVYIPKDLLAETFSDITAFVDGTKLVTEEIDGNIYTDYMDPVIVECHDSFAVHNNRYWKYIPTSLRVNPSIAFDMPLVVPGYTYDMKVIFAPETNDTVLALPNKVRMTMFESREDGTFKRTGVRLNNPEDGGRDFYLQNATQCDTVAVSWTPTNLCRCMLQIQLNVRSNQTSEFSRELRIVGIIVERKLIKEEE